MANKKTDDKRETGASAPVFFLCLLLTSGVSSAQNLSKYYVSSTQPDGILYFIKPQTNFNNPEIKTDFTFDVTYLNTNDSATVNFTYFDKKNIYPESITIAYGDWKYQTTLKRIYVDVDKDRWRYRYTLQIPFDQLVIFYRANAPVITITTNTPRTITIKPVKQWEKNADINHKIMQIIQINKKSISS